MPNAQDYFTAAKIIRADWDGVTLVSSSELAEYLESKAHRLADRERYAYRLGHVGQNDTPLERGRKLITWLLDAGWQPPSGTVL